MDSSRGEGLTIKRDAERGRWVLYRGDSAVSSAIHLFTLTRKYPAAEVTK